MSNSATNELWDSFCRLRLLSRSYRAVDDPMVAAAYKNWLASYLADETPKKSNVLSFRKPGVSP